MSEKEEIKSQTQSLNFIEQIIEQDIAEGKNFSKVHTRFPPEPNGYLHIGHAKSICLNFSLAHKYNAPCNLRFDDTNPSKEEQEYVDSIKEDVKWLGFSWEAEPRFTSDYFDKLYFWAFELIKQGKAYVDFQSGEQIAAQRGDLNTPGQNSPYRDNSIEKNLEEFENMRLGKYNDSEAVLRAKIDMESPNVHMRDPILYRVIKKHHHRTGDKWCIYPMYDYAHGQSDYIEGITHSICTLEFEVHRPLYEWFLDQLYKKGDIRPRQYEFARLNLSYTIMSKRKLLKLVQNGYVNGWDDPRMPTISGLRRRGYTPSSIRKFCNTIGVARRENVIDVALLEFCIREELNKDSNRYMAVLNPVKLVIENYPQGEKEWLKAENNPEKEDAGEREIPFSREIFIERDDFMEEAPKKFFRLTIGGEVRLKNAYIVKANRVEKDENGDIKTIFCSYDPDSLSGSGTENSLRKVKGTLHWVSAEDAIDAQVNLYDRLFNDPSPDGHKDKDFLEFLNPLSLQALNNCKIETNIKNLPKDEKVQFQRMGYFVQDKDSKPSKLIFNRIVSLKDSYKP